ncbi:hypothetical protein [Sediminibacillus massiliensis]|uniref:hypothetical protein n=1 Tax=Sediminibacillus massiliensis TaxID=1926277 RepID=UPI001FED1BF8|nr:hypothetical protein [Sediminibacillus massiliensis]
MIKAVSIVCPIILTIGIITFLVGTFGNVSNNWTGVGIGTIMGAVFIFLMGVFFKTTEEMLEKTENEASITSTDNVIPFAKK